jgi:glycosyltransferase involved in cell wall biosynthesis
MYLYYTDITDMSKYRIGIIAKDILNKNTTGIENYTINILNEFNKSSEFQFYLYTNHEYINKYKNIKHIYLKNRKAWLHTSLAKRIIQDDIDLIFSPIPSLPIITKKKIKKVITVHDLFFKYMTKNLNSTKLFFKNAILKSDKIISVSKYTKSEILKYYKIDKNKINVIYESYDKNLYKYISKKNMSSPIKILCVGTINKRKNFTQIVKVIPVIKDVFGDIKLTIIGNKGDDYENLLRTIKDFKLEKDIIVSGYVSNDELAGEYRKSDLFLYISKEEGFGLPILEAFASGVPVVTSENSSTKEIAKNAAILVDPENLMDIADGIIEAIKRNNQLIQLGLKEIEKFSWEKTGSETLKLFRELLN